MAANKAQFYILQFSVTVFYNTFSGRQQLSAHQDFTDASFIVIDCLKSCLHIDQHKRSALEYMQL